MAGWKIREPDGEKDVSFPFPERQELAQRIERLTAAGTSSAELERATELYKQLEGQFPVWPENWVAVRAFLKVRTQWRTGAAGAIGLDYPAVERRVERMKLAPDEQERVLEDIELMESHVLATWREESDRRTRELEAKGRH